MAKELPKIGEVKPDVLELNQFWRYQGKTYCFKPTCDDCKYLSTCENEEITIKVGPGVNVRRAFIAPPGYKIVSIDYKGVEIRIAAQLSKEPFWVNAFKNNRDLHQEFAKVAFKTENPTKTQRDHAKAANFGNLYLGTAHTLHNQTDLTLPEAIYIHREWWKAIPQYAAWVESQKAKVRKTKQVETFFGRVRHLARLVDEAIEAEQTGVKKGKGKAGWPFIERTSVNSPVQGTSADLMKIAMIRINEWINKEGLHDSVKVLLTVHDEIVFMIKDDEYFFSYIETLMDKMVPDLSSMGWEVPLGVDVEIGQNWADMQDLSVLKKERGIEEKQISGESTKVQVLDSTNDRCVLVFEKELTKREFFDLQMIINQATAVPNVIRVPLRFKIRGTIFKPDQGWRVHEPTLRKLMKDFEGISFEE